MGILPNHEAWRPFLANLRAVVVDEAHAYRGVFGSHVANVLRRLRRLVGHDVRFLMASATIANPVRARRAADRAAGLRAGRRRRLARRAQDRGDVEPAADRRGARHPPLRAGRGGRRRRRARARGRADDLLHEVAPRGRAAVALRPRPAGAGRGGAGRALPRRLHAAAAAGDRAPAGRGRAARASSPRTRWSSASTSASSTPRSSSPSRARSPRCGRCGARAGRRGKMGLAVYVAGEDALDQFFCRHPDEFFDRAVEAAILDHANEQIYAGHLVCAAHEAPLDAGRRGVLRDDFEWHAERLVEAGRAAPRPPRPLRPRHAERFPAADVSLRSASRRRLRRRRRDVGRADRDGRGRARVHHHPRGRRLPAHGRLLRGRASSTSRAASRWSSRSRATGTRSPRRRR